MGAPNAQATFGPLAGVAPGPEGAETTIMAGAVHRPRGRVPARQHCCHAQALSAIHRICPARSRLAGMQLAGSGVCSSWKCFRAQPMPEPAPSGPPPAGADEALLQGTPLNRAEAITSDNGVAHGPSLAFLAFVQRIASGEVGSKALLCALRVEGALLLTMFWLGAWGGFSP